VPKGAHQQLVLGPFYDSLPQIPKF